MVFFFLYLGVGGGNGSREASPCADDTDTVEARGPLTPSSTSSLTLLTHTQAENAQLRRQCDELNRANKLYEEQILLMRDKLRDLELKASQQSSSSPSPQRKSRSQSINSITRNHMSSSSLGRSVNEVGASSGLEAENVKLQDRVMQLEDQLNTSNEEKDSLISTLQFLQEELLQSERRSRSNTAAY